MESTLARRLSAAMESRSVKDVSEETGIAVSTLRSYLRGVEPKAANVALIADATGYCLEWIVSGKGLPRKDSGDAVSLPYIAGAWLSADQKERHRHKSDALKGLLLPKTWIAQEIGPSINPEHLRWLYVEGDSMGMTLRNDNLVIVQMCPQGTQVSSGIYVLHAKGELIVRRIQPSLEESVLITADNPAYKNITVHPSEICAGECCSPGTRVVAIGRIVYVCHRFQGSA